jgi:multiple sugar transport system substrate-binding protein
MVDTLSSSGVASTRPEANRFASTRKGERVATRTLVRSFARTVTALLIVTLVTAACGLSNSNTGTGGQATNVKPKIAKEPKKPVTITFSSWVASQGSPILKWAEQFHKIHPNITIQFQTTTSDNSSQKLTTEIAGGNPPDSAFMDSSAVGDFGPRGALVNLDGYIAGSKVVQGDDYVPGFKSAASYKGHMFALPFEGETTSLFYRTDLFQKAGISRPPTTWDELKADAAKLTDPAQKTYGWFATAPEAAYYWYPFLWQAGGQQLTPDGQKVALDSPQGQAAANFYVSLTKYAPPDYLPDSSWDGRVAFAAGKVAMYMAGQWFGGDMKSEFPQINGKWAVAPLPEGPQGCATSIAGDDLGIFAQSKNQDAAWMWIEYLSSKEHLAKWTFGSKTSTELPTRESLLHSPSLGKYNPWLKAVVDNMKCAVSPSFTQTKWGQVDALVNTQLGKAMYGDVTATQALKTVADQGNKILAGNG